MVCATISNKHSIENTPKTNSNTKVTNACLTMDRLELQHLTGGNIIEHKPIFSANGSFLFVRVQNVVQIYATGTGELTRELTGATDPLVSMELELKEPDILVACTCEGELLRWHWHTGVLLKSLKLDLIRNGPVYSFNLLNMYRNSPTACAFVTMSLGENLPLRWKLVDTTTGKRIQVSCTLPMPTNKPIITVGVKNFKYVVVAQAQFIYFLNYNTWQWVRYKNANLVPVTAVAFSPSEELVATGDEQGRIFLWRQFQNQKQMRNTLYHWHHTAVTSISFSASGTSFYSSGHESVLVKWNVGNREIREFLPRLASIVRHIAVSEGNEQVVISTDDNAVQFIGASDNSLKSTLQHFTYSSDEKTGKSIFPIGLRLDPRANTLVLNGRIGHLQFYSTYNKNLLYNLRVVEQNHLSMESDHILYNVCVTKAAFNIDWMATGEVLNDEEHFPELRLKFWKYNENRKQYTLNTNIELPHKGGFKDIAFSNNYKVDNLLCATVGEDHIIKVWALDLSDNIYNPQQVWSCIAQTQYRNMDIESICFSQDGSLLAAGYGNTLCVYKAETLKLRAALTGSAGMDGTVAKAQLRLAKQTPNGAKNELQQERKQLWQLFRSVLDTDDNKLIKELQAKLEKTRPATPTQSTPPQITDKTKAQIYAKICEMHELNLYQKLQLMQKFDIRCEVEPKYQTKLAEYLQQTIDERTLHERATALQKHLLRVNHRQRYKAKYRIQRYAQRKRHYDQEITQKLVPIMSMLELTETTIPRRTRKSSQCKQENTATASSTSRTLHVPQMPAEITHVQFAAGEHAHLVVVCTETRVLIWNLLTLRLQAVLKLSVRHLAFDAQTNLLAVVTKYNELHVFQPNVPLPIYQRANLPNLHGMIWLPRRQPKKHSINVDWQAQSTLYFLTETQEIKYLEQPDAGNETDSTPPSISFAAPAPPAMQFTTFGTYATQQHSELHNSQQATYSGGALIVGRGQEAAVNALVNLSSHTMPPLHMLCSEFVKSLLKPAESTFEKSTLSNGMPNGDTRLNGNGLHSDDEDEEDDEEEDTVNANVEMKEILETRKTILYKTEALAAVDTKPDVVAFDLEKELQRIANLSVDIEL